jgi:hypothetical protein
MKLATHRSSGGRCNPLKSATSEISMELKRQAIYIEVDVATGIRRQGDIEISITILRFRRAL